MEKRVYDFFIAGGGLSGCLSAARICEIAPEKSFFLAESEALLGGRLRTVGPEGANPSYGLEGVSPKLWEFILNTLALFHDVNPEEFPSRAELQAGVLSAGKISTFPIDELTSQKGVKAIGGASAWKEWSSVIEAMEDDGKSGAKPLSRFYKKPKKGAGGIVLHYLSLALGIPDIWTSQVSCFRERADFVESKRLSCHWGQLLSALVQSFRSDDRRVVQTDCRIVRGVYDEEKQLWKIITQAGVVEAKHLVVSQSPWEMIDWIDQKNAPVSVLNVALNCKPTSIVCLNEQLPVALKDLCDLLIVPAESVQVYKTSDKTVCYQTTIDYEWSLDAPSVVKAVKRLRRARKKLHKSLEIEAGLEHLSLKSSAWTQPLRAGDYRLFSQLNQNSMHSAHLSFCGDAYGASYDPDENMIASLLAMSEIIQKI